MDEFEPEYKTARIDLGRGRPAPGTIIGIAAALIVIGVGALIFFRSRVEDEAPVAEGPPVADAPAPPEPLPELGQPATEDEPEVEIPALDQSDTVVAQLLSALTSRPDLVDAMLPDRLVRRFVAVVDNVAEGVHPRPHMAVKHPEMPFRVREVEGSTYGDPGNSIRYDPWVDAFTSLEPDAAAKLYRRLEPRFAEAYRDLGYPNRRFDDALVRAFAQLVSTPIPLEEPALEAKVKSWAYADEQLEGLSPVQKQLLRLGKDNQRRILVQLRAIAAALGIPSNRLPSTHVY